MNRWLSKRGCYETFTFNYNFYTEIRDEAPNLFSPNEKRILDDRQIKEGAAHMLQQLDVVAHTLNIMQSDSSDLCDAMDAWLTLSTSAILCDSIKDAAKEKMKKAITPHHILAKMVSNKVGCELPVELKSVGMEFAEKLDKDFPGLLAALEVQDETVFPPAAFKESIRNLLDPLKYWRYIEKNTAMEPVKRFSNMALRILSCPPSSAGATDVLLMC